MYLEYFGLREEPFGATPDPRFLFLGESHRETLASLVQGVETGRGFMALIADPGMGKTTLISKLLEQTRTSCDSVFVFQTQCSRVELLRYLLTDSGVKPRSDDCVMMFSQFNEVLLSAERRNRRFVLVIDEAQNLSHEVLESVRLLSNFERPHSKLLQIILSGQSQFGTTLSMPQQQQLRQRMSKICRLHPLSPVDVQLYIKFRLAVAGRSDPLFTPEAVSLLANISCGIPRVINNYCFNLLSLGFARRSDTITDALVAEVANDLELRTTRAESGSIPTSSGNKREQSASVKNRMPRRTGHSNTVGSGDRAARQVGDEARPAREEPLVRTQGTSRSASSPIGKPSGSEVLDFLRGSGGEPKRDLKVPVASGFTNARYSRAATAAALSPARPRPASLSVAPQPATSASIPAAILWSQRIRKPVWMIATSIVFLGAIVTFGAWMRGVSVPDVPAPPTAPAPPTDNSRANLPLKKTDGAATSKRNRAPARHTGTQTDDEPVAIANGRSTTLTSQDVEPDVGLVALNESRMPNLPVTTSIPRRFEQPVAEQPPTVIPAQITRQIAPKYPPRASGGGDVQLTATIDEHGIVTDVESENSPDLLLSTAATAAVYQWRYSPATVNGKPVKSLARITIRFKKEL
jgi:TonB family protein